MNSDIRGLGEGLRWGQSYEMMFSKVWNLFFQTLCEGGSPPIQLRMQMVGRSSSLAPIGSFITGYSFFTIPSWTTIHYELIMTVKGANTSKTYRTEDTARMFMWLPLVVVSPFYNISTITDMENNMYLTALQQMQRDGFLIKQEAPGPAAEAESADGNQSRSGISSL